MADIPGGVGTRATLRLDPNFTFDQFERDGDRDWYRVTLRAGVDYAFDAGVAAPFGDDDGYRSLGVTLRDARGRELASDDGNAEYEAGFAFRAARSGTYYVEVDGQQGGYRLRADEDEGADPRTTKARIAVGEERDALLFFRNDVDTYRVELERGQAYDFTLDDDGSSSATFELLDRDGRVVVGEPPTSEEVIEGFEAAYTGAYFVRVASENQEFRSEYTLGVAEGPGAPPRTVRLTQGDDEYATPDEGGPQTVFALGGDDVVNALGDGDVVRGGNGDDQLFGGAALFGGAGDDRLGPGRGGTADGGAGNDTFDLGSDRAQVRGGAGADTFGFDTYFNVPVPVAEADTILDFGGADRIDPASIIRFLADDPGSALPLAFVGRAAFSGSPQVRYRFEGGDTLVLVDGDGDRQANLAVRLEGRQTLTAADFVLGAGGTGEDDVFEGTPGRDVVSGGAGDDVLRGAGGDDELDGGAGRDTLEGGDGRDRLEGGTGEGDQLDGGADADSLSLSGTEGRASGGGGDDLLNGSDSRDSLSGDAGDDTIEGNDGDDFVSGGEGDDRLSGSGGADRLRGDEGRDLLVGGRGGDLMEGGAGADRVVFGADDLGEFSFGGARDTVVLDAADVIDLSDIDANQGAAGNQAFAFIGTRAFSAPGQVRFERDDDGLLLQASTDLDRAVEFEVIVRNVLTLNAGDLAL